MEVVMENITMHQAMVLTVDVWDGICNDIVVAVYGKQGRAYDTVNLKGETERYYEDAIKAVKPANVTPEVANTLTKLSQSLQKHKELEDQLRAALRENEQLLREARRELRIATQTMDKDEFALTLSNELNKHTDMDARVSVLSYAEGKEMVVVDDLKHIKRNAFINDFPFIARYIGRGKCTIDEQSADYQGFVKRNAPEVDRNMEAISWRTSTGSEIDANNRMNIYCRYFVKLPHGFSRKSVATILNQVKMSTTHV